MTPDFHRIFESSPGLYLVLSPELKIIAVSDSYLRATMTRRAEIIGHNLFDIFPDNPDDLNATGVDNLNSSLQKVIKSKSPDVMALQKYDIRKPESEGGGFEVRYWSPLNSPVLNNANDLICIIHQVEDVTDFVRLKEKEFDQHKLTQELKASERNQKKNLKESEDRFKILVDNIKDYAIFMLDSKGYIQSWNEGVRQIKGYTEKEIIGKHISVFYPNEENQQNEPANNLKIAREKGRFEKEGWRVKKDGTKFWANVVFTALYDDKGNVLGYSKITKDITNQKKQEDAIKEANINLEEKVRERTSALIASEEQFKYALDNMLEGVQIIGFDWRYLYVNDTTVKHGAKTREELLGYTMMEKYPGIENSLLFKVLEECMNKRTTHHFENEFPFSNDESKWFELSIRPVPEGIFILSVDVTQRKKAEEEIKKLNENLEKKIAERTLQLETVNKELESFSYSVSHDLRAPLRAVTGYANMLEEEYHTKIDEEGKRLLGIIKYNAEKMGQLIDDLLAFSRLGRKEIQKSDIDMNEVVEGVLIEIDKTSKHAAEIKINVLHHIQSDYGLIHQVMMNLISNAIKYSSKKEKPFIEISSQFVEDELIFSVKDNGTGFDMKYYNKLFGVFQRLHSQEEFEGTGVGLAIVQRIIAKHGGRVWAEGIVGKGASFYFSVPKQ